MSPKSRGRPTGRGRPIKNRHLASTRLLTLHERVMMEPVYLGHDAPRLTAETAASQWLGEAWASADMGRRNCEHDLVEALVGELLGPLDNAAYLALAALAAIAAPEERDRIQKLEPGSHETEGVTGTGTAAVEITPDQALSEIAEALMVTDLYWPRQTDPGYTEMRAVAHARSRRFAVDRDVHPISDDERHELIGAPASR